MFGRTARRTPSTGSGRARLVVLLGAAGVAFGGLFTAIAAAVTPAYAATASLTPQLRYIGDSAGSVYTFTVKNTGASAGIGAVEIDRPATWTIVGCPTPPTGWTATVASTKCRFRSAASTSDDIKPGQSRTFNVKAKTDAGTTDRYGTWSVVVSKSNQFDNTSLLKYASATGAGLRSTLYTWEVTTAVVAHSPAVPGTACPAANKAATAGAVETIVVCGRNHASTGLKPVATRSTLGGSYVATPGTFFATTRAPGSTAVVLADWNQTTLTSVVGTTFKVIAGIGSASNQTSPLRTFTGYQAISHAPESLPDVFAATEDTTLNQLAPTVLTNDDPKDPGESLTASLVSTTSHGTLTLDPNGSFTYVPNANYNGPDSFVYKANDGHSDSPATTVTINVAAVQDAPVATDDSASTPEDVDVVVPVLGNDTDVDGDVLTISSIDDSTLVGSVTQNLDGTLTYHPDTTHELDGGEPLVETLTYTVSDGHGNTDTATATITVNGVNDLPDAVNDLATTDEANDSLLSPLANDTDAEGDTLSITAVDTTNLKGKVTDNANGTLTYSPNGAFEGLGVGDDDTDTFSYTISDGHGGTDTATVTVTVNGLNDVPDAVDDAPSLDEGAAATVLNVRGNDLDADGDTLTITGVDTTGTKGSVTTDGSTVSYDPNGKFEGLGAGETAPDTFTYTVSDGHGGTDTATVTVTVTGTNDLPVAGDDTGSTTEDSGTSVNLLANDTDAESPVTVGSIDTTGTKGKVTDNNDGTVTYSPNGKFEALANGAHEDDTFSYTVSDGHGGTDTATVTVTVNGVNDAPAATADSQSVGEDSAGDTVPVLGNDTDAESQTLAVSGVDTTGTTGVVTNNGTDVTYDPNGMFEYLGDGETATDTFTYTVTDTQGGTDTEVVTITVTGTNDAPVAANDTASTNEDTATGPISVLGNDSDAESTITIGSIDTTGTKGKVTDNNDGTVTYSPNGKFEALANGAHEDDTFSYTVSDGHGGTDTATVTVTVNGVNDAPAATADSQSVGEDSSGDTVPVLGNDTDAESQTLAVSGVDTTGTTGVVTNNGTDVTYDPNGMFEYLGDGETATDTFTYTVTDTQGGTDTETVTITVTGTNDAPVAANDTASTNEDTATGPISVLGNDSDAESTITVSAIDTTGTKGKVTDNNDGTVTYSPNGKFEALGNGEDDTDTFSYTVSDGHGGTDTATVTVTVNGVNDAPLAAADPADTGEDSSAAAIDVLANDTDAESETLTVSGVDTTGTTGSVTNNGTDVSYDPNGQFEGLDAGETAQDTFTYTVSDTQGGTDTETVTVTIHGANDAPVAANDAYQTLQDVPLNVAAPGVLGNDTDADGETITAGNASDPAHGAVTLNGDGSFTYTPASGYIGADSFTYDASDGTTTDTATVSITVASPNATPTADATSASGNEDGGAITVTLTGHDDDGDAVTFTAGTASNGTVGAVGPVTCDGLTPSTCSASVGYAPNANSNGSDSFTYTVNDGTIDSAPATATITVNPVNDVPGFTKGGDQTVNEDAGAQSVTGWATAISAGPANESAQTVSFVVTTNNDALFASLPTVNAAGDLAYTPAVNANGVATVTVKAKDDGGTANGGVDTSPGQSFTITVNAVNDAPSFTPGADQTVNEDAGAQSVSGWATALSKGPADESAQTLSFTVTNDNNTLFSGTPGQPAVSPTGTLTFTPAANAVGSATVTVTLKDTGGTANGGADSSAPQTFTITVNAVNDAPSFTTAGNQTVLEDAGAQTVNGFVTSTSAGPADEAAQTVTVAVTGQTNSTMFAVLPAITNGTLTYTPLANANGVSTVTVHATDDGGTANGGSDTSGDQTFTITVTAVNDAPSFTKGADQTLNEDAGTQSVSGWATAISRGPADEAGQTVSFTVSNNKNALFTAGGQPAVSPTGTLTFTSAPNQYGTAVVTVSISDNGGTANGGVDTSPTQSFTITVSPVNDPPVAAAKAFTVQANMKISLGGLLFGATDPNDVAGDPSWVASYTLGSITPGASCVGCTISNVDTTNGTFDFDPPAGGSGTYSVTYTVVDNGFPSPGATSAPQTITFTVNGPVIWFVDTTVAAGGTGRLSAPFNNLPSATTAMGTNTNQRIFVRGGNVTGNVTLQTDGWLISEAATGTNFDAVMGITPPAGTITRPSVNGTQRTLTGTVTVGTNSTVRGLNLTPSSGSKGLVGSGKTGLTVNQMSITAANARAVDLLNSAGTISLTTVNANGGDRGISLDGLNASSGSFTITGTGSAGSGGTIQNSTSAGPTGAGIYLNSAKNISLDRMVVNNATGSGIYGNVVDTFSIANSTISNNGTSTADDHSGISFDNLTGTSTMNALNVFGSEEHNIVVENTTGTANLTVSNSDIHDNTPATGGSGLYVNSSAAAPGNAVVNLTVTNNTIDDNRITGLQLFSQGTGKMTSTVSGGTYFHNGQGIDIATQGTGGQAFTVTGGTVTGCVACIATTTPGTFADTGVGVNVFKGSLASGTGGNALAGTITGMTINQGGTSNAPGVWVHGGGGPGETRVAITNNNVSNVAFNAIWVAPGNNSSGSQVWHATIKNNTVSTTPGSFAEAIHVQSGTNSTDNSVTCADISGNAANSPDVGDIRVWSRFAGTTLRLPGYTDTPTNTTAVQAYLKTQNPAITDSTAAISSSGPGFVNGAACTLP